MGANISLSSLQQHPYPQFLNKIIHLHANLSRKGEEKEGKKGKVRKRRPHPPSQIKGKEDGCEIPYHLFRRMSSCYELNPSRILFMDCKVNKISLFLLDSCDDMVLLLYSKNENAHYMIDHFFMSEPYSRFKGCLRLDENQNMGSICGPQL